jgi:hypothetical protein
MAERMAHDRRRNGGHATASRIRARVVDENGQDLSEEFRVPDLVAQNRA